MVINLGQNPSIFRKQFPIRLWYPSQHLLRRNQLPRSQFGFQRRFPEVRKRARIGCRLDSRVNVRCFGHKTGCGLLPRRFFVERDVSFDGRPNELSYGKDFSGSGSIAPTKTRDTTLPTARENELFAEILRDYERPGHAMRYLNVKGQIACSPLRTKRPVFKV